LKGEQQQPPQRSDANTQQLALIDRLLPHTAALSVDRHGSWLVERMFSASDRTRQSAMAAMMAREQRRIAQYKCGRVILTKLNIQSFQSNHKLWLQSLQDASRSRKAKLFSDIL